MAREDDLPSITPIASREERWSRAEFAAGVRQAGTDLLKTVMLARVVGQVVSSRRRR
jgi:hypothetical protein